MCQFAVNTRGFEDSRKLAESSPRIRESSRADSQGFAKVLNQFSTNSHIRMEVRKDIRLIHIGYPQFAAANLRMGDARPVMAHLSCGREVSEFLYTRYVGDFLTKLNSLKHLRSGRTAADRTILPHFVNRMWHQLEF